MGSHDQILSDISRHNSPFDQGELDYSAIIHVDHSSGVVPLERHPGWAEAYEQHDLPETYPFGL